MPIMGGILMHLPDEHAAPPPRTILARLLVRKWEYRFPRALLCGRLGTGVAASGFGVLLLSYGVWWGLLALVAGVLALCGGPYIYNKVTQSQPVA